MTQENVLCETTDLFSRNKCPCWQKPNVTFYRTARELTLVEQ